MGIVAIMYIMCVQIRWHTHVVHDCSEPFSLIIAVQILIAEPLDKWLKKRYNTTTLMS